MMTLAQAAPGLASLFRYDPRWLRADVVAGLSVAAVALPTGVAYADLVRVPAVVGIYAAIFPLFAYAMFGSSRQLITGPDSATCVLVAAALLPLAPGYSEHYVALVTVLTLVTALIHLVAGVLRLGFFASFLSRPILTGFLNGIALIIIAGQLKTLFGYTGTADDFFDTLGEFARSIDETHVPTLVMGLGLLAALLALRRLLPHSPQALLVVALGIALVAALGLDRKGVTVVGEVPAGLPSFSFTIPSFAELKQIVAAGASIALISFISGALTGESWARRNRYEVDPNQELIAFAACNLAAGCAQGFPVSGTDSRTAVNNAMGGKTQMAGIVAGIAMLIILLFLTAPLAQAPKVALAAVIIVSALGLFDLASLRELYAISRLEFGMCVIATAGALIFGVLQGVAITVGLSLAWLLKVAARPPDAVLGRVEGREGFYDLDDVPQAVSPPGVLIYQFRANLVFFNADYFKKRVREIIAAADPPPKWLILDASPVSYVDVTAVDKLDQLRDELAARGVGVVIANREPHLMRYFEHGWRRKRQQRFGQHVYPTVEAALEALHCKPSRPRRSAAPAAIDTAGER